MCFFCAVGAVRPRTCYVLISMHILPDAQRGNRGNGRPKAWHKPRPMERCDLGRKRLQWTFLRMTYFLSTLLQSISKAQAWPFDAMASFLSSIYRFITGLFSSDDRAPERVERPAVGVSKVEAPPSRPADKQPAAGAFGKLVLLKA